MKTYLMRNQDIRRQWFQLDAEGQRLGKLAVRAAHILMGKDKPTFTPGVDTGDFVVVTNAEKIQVSGRKRERKMYRHHTLYLGGLVEEPLQALSRRKPSKVIELAVRRMLPKNTLGRHCFRRLKVYTGGEHPHGAQKVERIEVSRRIARPAPKAKAAKTEER